MSNALAVRNDQRWTVVSLGFEEGLDGMRVAPAHGHTGDIDIAVADGLHSAGFLHRAFAAHRELGHGAAGSRLGHLATSVGVHLSVKHEQVHVGPGCEDVIESSKN